MSTTARSGLGSFTGSSGRHGGYALGRSILQGFKRGLDSPKTLGEHCPTPPKNQPEFSPKQEPLWERSCDSGSALGLASQADARKYDASRHCGLGCLRAPDEIQRLMVRMSPGIGICAAEEFKERRPVLRPSGRARHDCPLKVHALERARSTREENLEGVSPASGCDSWRRAFPQPGPGRPRRDSECSFSAASVSDYASFQCKRGTFSLPAELARLCFFLISTAGLWLLLVSSYRV
jgi:hypothetical protein